MGKGRRRRESERSVRIFLQRLFEAGSSCVQHSAAIVSVQQHHEDTEKRGAVVVRASKKETDVRGWVGCASISITQQHQIKNSRIIETRNHMKGHALSSPCPAMHVDEDRLHSRIHGCVRSTRRKMRDKERRREGKSRESQSRVQGSSSDL
eukprot:2356570-Rhodomonas_salina.3